MLAGNPGLDPIPDGAAAAPNGMGSDSAGDFGTNGLYRLYMLASSDGADAAAAAAAGYRN